MDGNFAGSTVQTIPTIPTILTIPTIVTIATIPTIATLPTVPTVHPDHLYTMLIRSRIVFDADSATLIRTFGCWFRWRWFDSIVSDPEITPSFPLAGSFSVSWRRKCARPFADSFPELPFKNLCSALLFCCTSIPLLKRSSVCQTICCQFFLPCGSSLKWKSAYAASQILQDSLWIPGFASDVGRKRQTLNWRKQTEVYESYQCTQACFQPNCERTGVWPSNCLLSLTQVGLYLTSCNYMYCAEVIV